MPSQFRELSDRIMHAAQTFFEQYRAQCEECNNGQAVCIPAPDPNNGLIGAKVMFINERPGRVGPGKSGAISFDNDDPSARWFKELFSRTGLERKEVFITNACIYYPADEAYRDRAPSARELLCSTPILKDQIATIAPRLLVPLGNTAIKVLCAAYPNAEQLHAYRLKVNIGELITDTELPIYPVYHTSLRARISRKGDEQIRDWEGLGRVVATQK